MNTASTISKPEALSCLVYHSRAFRPFDESELQELLYRARFRNGSVGITGMLIHLKGMFFQLLEGPENVVRETYQRIECDPRHIGITMLKELKIESRHFPQWSMGYPSPDATMLERLGGYSNLGKSGSKDLELLKSHGSNIYESMVRFSRKEG